MKNSFVGQHATGYKITFADNEHHADSMPIITLEVITSDTQHYSTDGSTSEQRLHSTEISHCYEEKPENILIENTSGVHFLTDDTNILKLELHENEDSERAEANIGTDSLEAALSKSRSDLLEYLLRNDGSVVCKLCGEILQSRTHWYRHKYKLHMMQNLNPSPLFQCEQCLVYFKSRKGYIGHISSRHGEISQTDLEPCPDVPAAQPPDVIITPVQVKQEPTEPDTVLQSTVPNYNTSATVKISTKTQVDRKLQRNTKSSDYVQRDPDWELKRSREEKLVSDIIDRVRRECEAQGAGGAARRGYTRRTTVMNM